MIYIYIYVIYSATPCIKKSTQNVKCEIKELDQVEMQYDCLIALPFNYANRYTCFYLSV